MQEDMHYYGVYALARSAGLFPDEARLISHASQFVDDATEDGAIIVDDDTRAILPTTTAHKALDVKNAIAGDQWKVWVPFHFLPDCGSDDTPFVKKMKCTRGNRVARDVLQHALNHNDDTLRPYVTGIALHSYADTYSHHGFWGFASKSNRVKEKSIEFTTKSKNIFKYLKRKFELFANRIVGTLAETVPVGHGSVATYPDRPYLKWEFEYEHHDAGIVQVRDNPVEYIQAWKELYQFFADYLARYPSAGDPKKASRWGDIRPKIAKIIRTEGTMKHRIALWWEATTTGALFKTNPLDRVAHYDEKEWKHSHVDLARDEVALFYKAAWLHRNHVLQELLPKYGVLIND